MSLVTSFFDILHEQPHEKKVVDAAVQEDTNGRQRVSVEFASNEDNSHINKNEAHSPPRQLQSSTERSPQISPYWYLEEDDKKAANQLTDKLTEKLLSMIIVNEPESNGAIPAVRVAMQKRRPPFSMNIMNTNSTKLAQKASPMFEGFDAVIMCFSWTSVPYTVGVAMVLTHAILTPGVAAAIPPFLLIHKFLLPAYLRLYPPDRSVVDGKYFVHNPVPHEGRQLRRYEPPRTVSQYSREFLMNFTDMQNHIVPYVRLHDQLIDWGKHYFLFEDHMLSSAVFLILVAIMAFNVVAVPHAIPILWRWLPIRSIAVVLVWGLFAACHPRVHEKVLDLTDTEEARLARQDCTYTMEKTLLGLFDGESGDDEPLREVEMFEMHRLDPRSHIWRPLGFAADCYPVNHPARAHDETAETTNTEDEVELPNVAIDFASVHPPKYWVFADDTWRLDMDPTAWVTANCIMDLVCIDDDEKWVYDIADAHDDELCYFRRRRWVRRCRAEGDVVKTVSEIPVRQIHRKSDSG